MGEKLNNLINEFDLNLRGINSNFISLIGENFSGDGETVSKRFKDSGLTALTYLIPKTNTLIIQICRP